MRQRGIGDLGYEAQRGISDEAQMGIGDGAQGGMRHRWVYGMRGIGDEAHRGIGLAVSVNLKILLYTVLVFKKNRYL